MDKKNNVKHLGHEGKGIGGVPDCQNTNVIVVEHRQVHAAVTGRMES